MDEPRILASCSSPLGTHFRALAFKVRDRKFDQRFYDLRVQQRAPEGSVYEELPLMLTFASLVLRSWRTAWPPESVDRLAYEENRLQLYYRDDWPAFYIPTFTPGLWRATFLPERGGAWTLSRLRSMDYEHEDKPPIPGQPTSEQSEDSPSDDVP